MFWKSCEANMCVERFSDPLRVVLLFMTWASQLLWVSSKQQAAGVGKVTESA